MSAIPCGFCGEQPTRTWKYCAVCGTPSNASVLPFPREDSAKASVSAREGALVSSTPTPVKPSSVEGFGRALGRAFFEIRKEIKSASWVYKLFFAVMAIALLYGLQQKLFESDENKRELPSAPARSTAPLPAVRSIATPRPAVQSAPVQAARQYSASIPKEQAIAFARKWFDAGSTASEADDILPFYSSAVDYYNKGVVNRRFIADDKARFIQRWPVRKNIMGDILFLGVGDKGEARLAIPFKWEVENSTQSKSGSASIELSIQDFDGQLLIVRESGG